MCVDHTLWYFVARREASKDLVVRVNVSQSRQRAYLVVLFHC